MWIVDERQNKDLAQVRRRRLLLGYSACGVMLVSGIKKYFKKIITNIEKGKFQGTPGRLLA